MARTTMKGLRFVSGFKWSCSANYSALLSMTFFQPEIDFKLLFFLNKMLEMRGERGEGRTNLEGMTNQR